MSVSTPARSRRSATPRRCSRSLWGVWLFGETVTPALALGGLLTLGGIFWTGRNEATAAEPAPDPAPRRLVALRRDPLVAPVNDPETAGLLGFRRVGPARPCQADPPRGILFRPVPCV